MGLAYPSCCQLCECNLPSGESADRFEQTDLCHDCYHSILQLDYESCPKCAQPVARDAATGMNVTELVGCVFCKAKSFRFESLTAVGLYKDRLRDVVLRVKQSSEEPLTLVAGKMIAAKIRTEIRNGLQLDAVTFVPIHWQRLFARKFNVAEILAEIVARELDLPLYRLLKLKRSTQKQGTLMPNERRENVKDAFAVYSKFKINKARILLVDDVMTTGSTVNEIAKTLLRAGAESVKVGVIARGGWRK